MAIDPDIQLPKGIGTFNEAFFDGLIRHQIGLMRLSGQIRNDVFKLLDATEADIRRQIETLLANHKGFDSPRSVQRLQTLLRQIEGTRAKAWKEINAAWVKQAIEISKAEPAFTAEIFAMAVPVTLETKLPTAKFLGTIARTRPFEGKVLRQWAVSMAVDDLRRISDAVKIGMVQGQSSQAIARRVLGTQAAGGANGVTQMTRNSVASVTRTMVTSMSNQARREYYRANQDIFSEEMYVATLDSRTTPICSSLDGKLFPIATGPIPPLHFNCRSTRVAVIDGKVIGERPARNFTQRGLLRESSAQRGISPVTTRAALPRGTKGTFDAFARTRMRQLTGTVPAKVNYGQWLNRQSAQFQDDVLGSTRGALFRRGDLKLDRFVNRAGDQIPLSELSRINRSAFIKAGLDPDDF